MTTIIRTAALASAVIAKRGRNRRGSYYRRRGNGNGMRNAAAAVGISAASISRVEAGKMVDLLTYAKLCVWLGVSLDTYVERPPWQSAIPE